MNRCAVLVDAGYLLGAAATLLVGGNSDRSSLRPDYRSLIDGLRADAEEATELPVLRIYWYDAARERQPTPAHRELRVLPDVKVRLGNLASRDDGRMVQKGVDADLHADLTTLARNRAVADIVLVTGDEDLRRAVEEAQEYGVRIHLRAVEAAASAYNQSEELIAVADRREVLRRDWIGKHIDLARVQDTATAEEVAPFAEEPAAVEHTVLEQSGPDRGAIPGRTDGIPVPSPAEIAGRLRRPPYLHTIADTAAEEPVDVPLLVDITPEALAWQDNEEDATEVVSDPEEIGYRYGLRWCRRASEEQYQQALSTPRRSPRRLDGDLLRYAQRLGIDTWEDRDAKNAVRSGFWRAVDYVRDAGEAGIDRAPMR